MNRTTFVTLLFAMLALALFAACSSGVDSMVDNYNEGFTFEQGSVTYISPSVSIYDADFDERSMLPSRITVNELDTLCLYGPSDGASYNWTATMIGGKDYDEEHPATPSLPYDPALPSLTVYIPDSQLETWASYKLKLEVSAADGTTYSCTTSLAIVEF